MSCRTAVFTAASTLLTQVSADGREKRRLAPIKNATDVYSPAWDEAQQRLFVLTTDHKEREWLRGFRVNYVKPGATAAAEKKP